MSARRAPLATASTEIAADADAVAAALRERLRRRTVGEGAPRLEADDGRRVYALEGGWWYRGEYTVTPIAPSRARVELRVFNVARTARWGVALANRGFVGFADRTRADFAALLADVAADLGVRAG